MTLYAYSTAKKFGSQSKKTSLTKNCIKKFCKDTGVRFTKVKYKTHVGTLKVDFSSLRSFDINDNKFQFIDREDL